MEMEKYLLNVFNPRTKSRL